MRNPYYPIVAAAMLAGPAVAGDKPDILQSATSTANDTVLCP